MLAEWSRQSALCLIWPSAGSDWDPFLPEIQQTYRRIIGATLPNQQVLLLCAHAEDVATLKQQFPADNFHVLVIASNQTWFRDFSPISYVTPKGLQCVQFNFNGWGKKYPCDLDNAVAPACVKAGFWANTPSRPHPLTIEGGNLESDGQGTVIVSQSCLTHQRNPGFSAEQIVDELKSVLNVQQILMLADVGLAGDDTDGHIDNLVRFANANTILYCATEDKNDSHFEALAHCEQQVQSFRNVAGSFYQTIPVPLPQAVYSADKERLPASYLNFVITNHVILLPQFACPADDVVNRLFQKLFPSHSIEPIDSTSLVQQYGGLHCATAAVYEDLS